MGIADIGRMLRRFLNVRAGRVSHQSLRRRILAGVSIDGIHVCQLIAAMIIASIGLNLDSTEAVIGAMLICPLMGSVLAIAYAVATLDRRLLRGAAMGLAVQVVVCLATSTIYFLVSPIASRTSELLTNSSATIWDVIIALVGGFAGALGTSRQQEPPTLIAGVAVATALMPPLCSVGFGLAWRDLVFIASAFYEFLINVVFIAFGANIVFVLLHVPLESDLDGDGVVTAEEETEARKDSHTLRRRLGLGLVIFAIPCLFFSAQLVRQQVAETGTLFEIVDAYDTELLTKEIELVAPQVTSYRIGSVDSYDMDESMLSQRIVATVGSAVELDDSTRQEIEALIRLHVAELDEVAFVAERPVV